MSEIKQISSFLLGDMKALYTVDEAGIAGFELLPICDLPVKEKVTVQENLVQVKLAGDIYNEAYAMGISMRNGESTRRLKYVGQEHGWSGDGEDKLTIITHLKDDRGYIARHMLTWEKDTDYIAVLVEFTNNSKEKISLEMLESFSLQRLTPYVEADAHEAIDLYRIRSVWSGEGRVDRSSLEELALEKSWADHSVRCERYGQVGSMPVNHFFPFGVIYDKKNHVYWGAQIAHNAAWQMEVYRKDEGVSFSGGLADREFGHWLKDLKPGETFATPAAILSVAKMEGRDEEHDFDLFCQRLTSQGLRNILSGPESEKSLPVIFNEYCTTWGNPSAENIKNIVNTIRDKGFSYFVIDCGWYKQEGIPWDRGMGDYKVSKALFPEGLKETIDYINDAGMTAGIWFEIENVASEAEAYKLTEHLLKRDGKPLTTYFRRFWDMKDPWVIDYLTQKVIGTLKEYGIGYMKMDYNESFGIGCDGAESLGEGLRRNMKASEEFVRKVKEEIPGIILENCASGGHRLEPLMMSLCSMASFSDAHECPEIPIIAANLHRVIHPAQSQIWAVIRKTDDIKRITYSLVATLLGRMCVSGDVTDLDEQQWKCIGEGISFYKNASSVILKGRSNIYPAWGSSMRHPRGFQVVVRKGEEKDLIVIHTFEGFKGDVSINMNVSGADMSLEKKLDNAVVYQVGGAEIKAEGGRIIVRGLEEFDACAILL